MKIETLSVDFGVLVEVTFRAHACPGSIQAEGHDGQQEIDNPDFEKFGIFAVKLKGVGVGLHECN